MPCNTVVTNTVELANIKDQDLLMKALVAEFGVVDRRGDRFAFRVNGADVSIERGRASSYLPEADLGKIVGRVKQSYSREAIKMAAKRFGWAVVPGADANHFQVVKR